MCNVDSKLKQDCVAMVTNKVNMHQSPLISEYIILECKGCYSFIYISLKMKFCRLCLLAFFPNVINKLYTNCTSIKWSSSKKELQLNKRPKGPVSLTWSSQIHWALFFLVVVPFHFQFKILYKLA